MGKTIIRSKTTPGKRVTTKPKKNVPAKQNELPKSKRTYKRRVPLPVRHAIKSKPAPKQKKIAKAISKTVIQAKAVSKKDMRGKAIPKKREPVLNKTIKAIARLKGYTAAEYTQYKEYTMIFADKSNQLLKDLLRTNQQSMTGNKAQLINKCADGATLGAIPRCPKCFGGKLKFDCKTSRYYCTGFHDDTEFTFCHSTFTKSRIKRNIWDNRLVHTFVHVK